MATRTDTSTTSTNTDPTTQDTSSPTPAKTSGTTSGAPNSPRAAGSIGTGAPTTATTDYDPNIDIARAQARDVQNRKQAAGEKTGEAPPDPVSLAGQAGGGPTGPVPDGMKRVRVLGNVSSGGKMYSAGSVADIPEGDFEAFKNAGSVEAV